MSLSEYLVLRYSLVEEAQKVMEPTPIPKIKGHSILPAISSDREFKYLNVIYNVLKFKILEPSCGYDFPENRFYIGKIAKCKRQQTGEKIPGDIIEYRHDHWVPINIIIDIETQHIFVRKSSVYGTPEHIVRTLQIAFTQPILSTYNHRIFIEGKSETSAFWKIVNSKDKIYKMEFKLISPNILDTNKKARDALEQLKNVFGQDEIDITLKNESGDLKVPKPLVENYLDYIAEGEGSWNMVTEGERSGKQAHSSVNNIDTVNLPLVKSENKNKNKKQMELGQTKEKWSEQNYTESHLGAEVYATIRDMGKI